MNRIKLQHPVDAFRFCPRCGHGEMEKHSNKSVKCKKCDFLFYFNANGAVIALIKNANDELLVTRRAFEPFKGTYDLPGGFVDPGETAEQALKREIKEELNLDITTYKYLSSYGNIYPFSGIEVYTVDLIFEASVKSFECIQPADDVSEILFFSKQNLNPKEFGLNSISKTVELFKNER